MFTQTQATTEDRSDSTCRPTSVTVPEDPPVRARRPVRERPDIRRDSPKLVRSAVRADPLPRRSSAAPAPPAHRQPSSRGPTTPTLERTVSTPSESSDSSRGPMLFFTFVAAVLVMVLAVWLAAVVGQWWILIPVVAVDLIVTTAVTSVVIWMLADGANPALADIRSRTPTTGLEQGPDGSVYAREPAHAA